MNAIDSISNLKQRLRGHSAQGFFAVFTVTILAICLAWTALPAAAQTGGQGALEGTVTDSTGLPVVHATVTAINQASGVTTTQTTSSAGVYQITPLIPGIYTATVMSQGFETLKQENIEVDGVTITGFNPVLRVGSVSETITITDAPPLLQTTNATLGGVITNEIYESLPILMNNQQRDPTAAALLLPGAGAATRAPNMSGTGQYLSEVYMDGIPTTTANQQSDNRPISNSIPIEAVDQMAVLTNGATAEYQGAGALSFTTKSGGDRYHGTIADFVRNTAFDAWGFTAPAGTKTTLVNGVPTTVRAGKPVEHQNEISISLGGPIRYTRGKGFFFGNWDEFHSRSGTQPSLFSIPTTLMRQGDFSELGQALQGNGNTGYTTPLIYNPLTNSCTGNTCTRQPFQSNGNYNVIPQGYISPISQYEEKFLPPTSLQGISNNYLGGGLNGFDNHELQFKVDYDVTNAQRFSFVYSRGVRASVGFGSSLPLPYTTGISSTVIPLNMIVEHRWILSANMVNQLKYAFTRQSGGSFAPTAFGNWAPDAGITGLPPGQASQNFPCSSFSTTTPFPAGFTSWTQCGGSDESSKTIPNAYTLVDNLQWSKGKNALTFGIQMQWLQDNVAAAITPSGVYTQTWSGADTANFNGTSLNTGTGATNASGYSYSSFLVGAVHSAGTSVPLFADYGGRYFPISPYVQDDLKINPRLTLNLGMRWDYMPPYHEVLDRWSYFNTAATDPITNTPGELEFVGNWGGSGASCNCRTPVQTYWKNWGPRLGLAWEVDDKTVIRAGFSVAYSHSGGVGGRVDAGTGASQLGFGSSFILPTAITTGATAGPSYYLNNGSAFTAAGVANTNFGGPGFSVPAPTLPTASAVTLNIGNYANNGAYVAAGAAPGYADPYLASRAPEFEFFNFGLQRALTKDLTIMANYAGSESHFIGGAGQPGSWSGNINPNDILQLASTVASDGKSNIFGVQATAANIAIAQAADPGLSVAPWYAGAGALSATPTIGRWLRPYPKYSSPPSAVWDNVANVNYHSLQITLNQRDWKGLTYVLNYTYSKNIGDDGTTRSSFPVPAGLSSNGIPLRGNNAPDRDLTTNDTPQDLAIYGLYNLPFGKGHIGGDNFFVRNIVGGWGVSGVFTYLSGNPLLVVGSGCNTPNTGQCMPDLVPGMKNQIRQNGSWGKGLTAANLKAVSYLNSAAFKMPTAFPLGSVAGCQNTMWTPTTQYCSQQITRIGDSPRTRLNLWGPSKYNLNASVRRTFNITPERVRFVFQADCTDVTNKVTFGGINVTWSPNTATSTFGQVTSASGIRDFQFSGRINF